MKKNRPIYNAWIRRMYISFVLYCTLVTVAAIIMIDTAQRKANDAIQEYHEQAMQEITNSTTWRSGEYPQWFIEWRNTEFYNNLEAAEK